MLTKKRASDYGYHLINTFFFAKDRSGDIKNSLLTPNRLMFKEGLSGELNKPLATGERVAARVLLACDFSGYISNEELEVVCRL